MSNETMLAQITSQMNPFQLRLMGSAIDTLDELDLEIMVEEADDVSHDDVKQYLKMSKDSPLFMDGNDGVIGSEFVGLAVLASTPRAYWAFNDGEVPQTGVMPVCSSKDGKTGRLNIGRYSEQQRAVALHHRLHPFFSPDNTGGVKEDNEFDCSTCPLAKFNGNTPPPCKYTRRLLVFIVDVNGEGGQLSPYIMNVPVTSARSWDTFASAAKQKAGQKYFVIPARFWIEKALKGSIKYSVLRVAPSGDTLTTDEKRGVLKLRKQYAEYFDAVEDVAEDAYTNGHNGSTIDGSAVQVAGGQVAGESSGDIPF